MDAVQLSVFSHRLSGICAEMGALLQRAAFSPNIKDRLDFSCAVFDAAGGLCAQAAHIPVHLGSMAFAMADVVAGQAWQPGDLLVVNDPFLGGTHLPDVTVVAPVFDDGGTLLAFAVTRAHHAHIGATAPGSMPISCTLEEEGVVIAPQWLRRDGRWARALLNQLLPQPLAAPEQAPQLGDFVAQASACDAGARWLAAWIADTGVAQFRAGLVALNAYAERLARQTLAALPDGDYHFADQLDDDGQGTESITVQVTLRVRGECVEADFTGTADQVPGNLNCPLSVAAAAVFYCFRCLMPAQAPACAGLFAPITLTAPVGSLVNAQRPAATAAGNVETSTRIVDVVLGALAQALPERIPAASHGSMNNLALGRAGEAGRPGWDYYETMGGGMGAGPAGAGLSGRQTHMTNTLNTPIESLESHYPLRVLHYGLRAGSGGAGRHRGGDGLVRELLFLAPATVTLLTERRVSAPWGLAGGEPGLPGRNWLNGKPLPAKVCLAVCAGDRLRLESAGGGGHGAPAPMET